MQEAVSSNVILFVDSCVELRDSCCSSLLNWRLYSKLRQKSSEILFMPIHVEEIVSEENLKYWISRQHNFESSRPKNEPTRLELIMIKTKSAHHAIQVSTSDFWTGSALEDRFLRSLNWVLVGTLRFMEYIRFSFLFLDDTCVLFVPDSSDFLAKDQL